MCLAFSFSDCTFCLGMASPPRAPRSWSGHTKRFSPSKITDAMKNHYNMHGCPQDPNPHSCGSLVESSTFSNIVQQVAGKGANVHVRDRLLEGNFVKMDEYKRPAGMPFPMVLFTII